MAFDDCFSVLALVCLVLKSHCSVWSFAFLPAFLVSYTIKTGADDSLEYFSLFFFSEKIRLDIFHVNHERSSLFI